MLDDRGLLDTSVVINLEEIDPTLLPLRMAVGAITLAELAAGPHATGDAHECARRQDGLQRVEAVLPTLPFDRDAARAYGRICAAAAAAGRTSRSRIADFFIAATALSAELPLYTRNPADFAHLNALLEIRHV